jgi:hypothetical protein
VFATAAYTQPRPWFDKAPEGGVDKGNVVASFPILAAEIDALGKTAVAAGGAWGKQLQALQAAEATRDARRTKIAAHLKTARDGKTVGFYQFKEDPATKLLDLDEKTATPVKGPDNATLKGADTLLAAYNQSVDAVAGFAARSTAARKKQKELGDEVVLTETRLLKQREIRTELLAEAFYLSSFEVNVAEQRDTVVRRRAQLARRLEAFK